MTLQRLAICLSMAALLTILFRYFIVHDKDVDELLARYVAGGQIATEIKDTAIEQAATSKRTKLLVGYAFYNYVYQLMHERYPNLVKHVRTDEKYDPADMNLIFITRDNDPDNLLGIFNVETVKYIGRNIILINKECIDELARIQIVSLTDYQNNYFILKDGHYSEHGEDTFNRLSRKQLSEVYGLMFASYVIIHEIVKSL